MGTPCLYAELIIIDPLESKKMADGVVQELNTKERFDECIKANAVVLVDYTAPWCARCQAIAPVFASLAKDLAGDCVVASVDVDENEDTPVEQEIGSLPTIQLYKGGVKVEQLDKPPKDLELRLRDLVASHTAKEANQAAEANKAGTVSAAEKEPARVIDGTTPATSADCSHQEPKKAEPRRDRDDAASDSVAAAGEAAAEPEDGIAAKRQRTEN